MDIKVLGGLVARHALGGVAAYLAGKGLLATDGSQTEAFVGAGMFFVALAWSAYQKLKAGRS